MARAITPEMTHFHIKNIIGRHAATALLLLSVATASATTRHIASLLKNPQMDKLPVCSVHCIFQDSEGYIWYGTVDGLCRDDGYDVQIIRNDFLNPRPMGSNLILSIGESADGGIVFTTPAGAYRLDKADCHIAAIPNDSVPRYATRTVSAGGRTWSTADVPGAYQLIADRSGHRIWAVTGDDIRAYDVMADGTLHSIDLAEQLAGYTAERKMLSRMTLTADGDIWIAGYDRASMIVSFETPRHTRHEIPAIDRRFSRRTVVVTLAREADSLVWFSQDRVGLCLYDERSGRLTTHSDCPTTSRARLGTVHELIPSAVRPHQIWALTDAEFVYGIEHDGMQMRLTHTIVLPDRHRPKTLFEDHSGRLWIGTYRGLFMFDADADSLHAVAPDLGHVTSLTQTADGRIWAAVSGRGVAKIDGDTVADVLPLDNDLLSIANTSDGRLWIGTGTGELLTMGSDGTFASRSAASGMNGDMVEKIVADSYNHLWILTNRRLTEYDPTTDNYRVVNANAANSSLSLARFMPRALSIDAPSGTIMAGGFDGFLTFAPSLQIEGMARNVAARITDVKVAGRSLPFDIGRPLDAPLPPDAHDIEIHFSTLDHLHAAIERYAYRIDDGDWVALPTGVNRVTFQTLGKGAHRMQLRATDENGLWSSRVTDFTVVRQPHWWETTAAGIVFGLLAASTIALMLRYAIQRIRRDEKELWGDSAELLAMRRYVDGATSDAAADAIPFAQIDRMLTDKAADIIRRHLGEADFSIVALAAEMNMSRSTLVRKIKVITGKTPLQFVRDVKMQAACQMLQNHTATIADVAQKLGYTDRDHFSRIFREAIGQSPSEWQQANS
ncbi:MAG: helix-turn-helix domain-containing protein [Bacteroidales bacterium]|nr:helix-turn-helix domain-containing protein [Bacteroidales bacterium]